MKKLLSILGAVSLTATGADGVIACNSGKINQIQNIIDNDKILKENINNTSLDNFADSTMKKQSKEVLDKMYEFQDKEIEHQNKFETNNKDIDFQLWQLFYYDSYFL